MRKLVTVRTINDVVAIENADAIEQLVIHWLKSFSGLMVKGC
jgi:hypothetical protein